MVPAARPWRGLAIGGGVALAGGAVMLGMLAAGAARSSNYEDDFEMSGCDLDALAGMCADIYDRGKAANATAVAGLVLGPALVGAGIGLLVVAVKRKRSPHQAWSPLLDRGLVGLGWQRHF